MYLQNGLYRNIRKKVVGKAPIQIHIFRLVCRQSMRKKEECEIYSTCLRKKSAYIKDYLQIMQEIIKNVSIQSEKTDMNK